ncbi:MAG: diguanylate cyclase [Rhodocyclaceae bacterium]|nr:diguanylate cyclase [Rhodocyclaceae bacterium]MBX3667726.1 diguanylate cyclase [Rhodocyclaceae bacterium]
MNPATGKRAYLLIVDDTPTNIQLLAEALSTQYKIRFATNGPKALQMADQAEPPDLILLDVMMPGMDGYEVCRKLKENDATRNIPVIFVTAKNEIESQERGFNVGGVDYITKPFDLALVRARVRTHVNLKWRTDLLEQLANLDGLTGIANRRRFNEMLEAEWKRAGRADTPLTLLMMDVDHFKLYNDHYGHGAGDDCLREIADALAAALPRTGDVAARYGGEEFAAILPGCSREGAAAVAERIQSLVAAKVIPHAKSATASNVTVSIGTCTLEPGDPRSHTEVLEAADQALYRAKQEGRNRAYHV